MISRRGGIPIPYVEIAWQGALLVYLMTCTCFQKFIVSIYYIHIQIRVASVKGCGLGARAIVFFFFFFFFFFY